LAVASALVEWAGWQIAWRHGGGPRPADPAWPRAYVVGTVHTLVGALGVGTAGAAAALAAAAAVPRWRASARRIALAALGIGAAAFLGLLAVLTRWAP
jgi:hypothetical protein